MAQHVAVDLCSHFVNLLAKGKVTLRQISVWTSYCNVENYIFELLSKDRSTAQYFSIEQKSLTMPFRIQWGSVFQHYHLFLQKGVRIDQIITYAPARAAMISWLYHLFNNVLHFVVAVGTWIGLVSYYKRSEKQHWIRKLF